MTRFISLLLLLLACATPAAAQRYVLAVQVQEPGPAPTATAPPANLAGPRWGEAFPTLPPAPSAPPAATPAPAPTAPAPTPLFGGERPAPIAPPAASPTPAQAVPAAPAPAVRSVAGQHRLGPGDRIRVVVFGVEQLSGVFDVEDTGDVAFPLVGPIRAEGVTTTALEQVYADALRGRYVLDPKVSVQIDGYRPIYVLGEVGEPGSYPYEKGMTLMAAVATARGFAPRANKRYAMVRRAGSAQEVRIAITPDALVRPGDTIRIPERFF